MELEAIKPLLLLDLHTDNGVESMNATPVPWPKRTQAHCRKG